MNNPMNHAWHLVARPDGQLSEDNFEWRSTPVGEPADGEILVRVLYLSLDPTNRGWTSSQPGYLPPVPLGEVMRGSALGIVAASRNPRFATGELVSGTMGWQAYYQGSGRGLRVVRLPAGMPLTAHFGLLGHIGMTAYFGLLDLTHPQPGETLVISAAAGAVGSLVGQIGKLHGCRVVGIAGSDDKLAWLTEQLGFDAGINYKTQKVSSALRAACPDGIDIYFENVGGEILDAVLAQINLRARIALCGLIAQYNAPRPLPTYNLGALIIKRARIEGFLVLDYADRREEAEQALIDWYQQGKLQYRVDVVEGLEQAPRALNRLFDGSNQGKLMVQVSAEP